MKPERTADDKLLALLARVGRPLERSEICEELSWTRQRAAQVLTRLVLDDRIVSTPGEAVPGEPGRPPALYALPGMEPTVKPAGPYFVPETIVITPSGREARVKQMLKGGYAEIEYLVVRDGHEPRATLRATLLRAFQPGRERPDPVRVTSPAPEASIAAQAEDAETA